MPQLDLASFLPQVFWFILIFFSYYIIVVNNILPSLSRILKIRTKKLSEGKEVLTNMSAERKNLLTNYDSFVSQSLRESGQFLQTALNLSNTWISQSNLTSEDLVQNYLGALANLSASQTVLRTLSNEITASVSSDKISMKFDENFSQSNKSLWELVTSLIDVYLCLFMLLLFPLLPYLVLLYLKS